MSLTPIGDSLRARFGGRISTHALGTENDPAGCEAWHSYCAYSAGAAEALRSLAADLEARGGMAHGTEAARAFRRSAQIARERASASPGATNPAQSVSGDAGTGSVDLGDADCMEAGRG